MKKLVSVFCVVFMLCMVRSPVGSAEGDNYDTLTNWNIKVSVPEGTTAVLDGSEYYIYAQQEGSIPYVMLRTYQYDDAVTFLDDFTEYMQGLYPDLKVTSDIARKTFGQKKCFEIDYCYQVSGYEVRDRRIALVIDGTAYLFSSKEIEELGMTIGSMLDDVVADSELLISDNTGQSTGLAPGYLYCQENGMPKYWLDFTGAVSDDLVLHCWFRADDRTYVENCFILDLSTAVVSENALKICQVRDLQNKDCSEWFKELMLQFYLDAAVMTVERDEKTLAGGAEDSILTGTYVMTPVGVSADGPEKQSHLRPAENGPYQPEELSEWAQYYYFRNTGIYPAVAELIENSDGTVTIRLAEEMNVNSLTSESYTVDAYGEGKNDNTGAQISLMQ